MRIAADFFSSKTTIASLATIATTIAGALQGQITPFHAALVCLAALHLTFLRDAWVKNAEDILEVLDGVHAATSNTADAVAVKP